MTTTKAASTDSRTAARLPTLVTAGTGKTGRRIVRRLTEADVPVRVGSRRGVPRFDWEDETSWPAALDGVGAVYLAYVPDLGFPGAAETLAAFADAASLAGVQRLVLLSGRGEVHAQHSENVVMARGVPTTVVRASWFMQDFDEHFLLPAVLDGVIALPSGDVGEPFIDAQDVAEVAVAALLDERHAGQIYEVTGPQVLTFTEAAGILSEACGRDIGYLPITPDEYAAGARAAGIPEPEIGPMIALFTEVLDGHNAQLADGVQRVLGRPPGSFADYARRTAASGIWDVGPADLTVLRVEG